jgi:hypothetical protein
VGANLIGNGVNTSMTPATEYVQVATNMIGFQLMASNQPTLTGTIRRMGVIQGQSGFRLSINVPANVYVGGQLTVAGETFTVTATNGSDVAVNRVPTLPFFLLDDDAAQSPFLQVPPLGTNAQGGTPFDLMQTSDDASRNLYAPAYVKPVYDLRTLGTASFNRNVEDNTELGNQLMQTHASTSEYWVVYLQGAFQGPAFRRIISTQASVDADPDDEVVTVSPQDMRSTVFGQTRGQVVHVVGGNDYLVDIGGSAIYLETIRDFALRRGFSCFSGTIVHETGHQFGLLDGSGGIMEPCSMTRQNVFNEQHLRAIRERLHPQDN